MDGQGGNGSASQRWTCEACGCITNQQTDRSCTICGTSHSGASALRRGPGFVGRPAWFAREYHMPRRIGALGVPMNDNMEVDEDWWDTVVDGGDGPGDDLESLAMELSNDVTSRNRYLDANRLRFLEAARAFSRSHREAESLDPSRLLQFGTENAQFYHPRWEHPAQLIGRNRGSNDIEVGTAERQSIAHLPLTAPEGRAVRTENSLPKDIPTYQGSFSLNSIDRRRRKVWGFRIAFDHPSSTVGEKMGGNYLIGVCSASFTAYGEQNSLRESPFFWGIDDSGRKYEGSHQARNSRRSGTTSFGTELSSAEVSWNNFGVLFGSLDVITVVCDAESRTLTFWRNDTLLGTLVTNLPRSGHLYPVAVPYHGGVTVAITALNNDPLPLLRAFASDWKKGEVAKVEQHRQKLMTQRSLFIENGRPTSTLSGLLYHVFTRYVDGAQKASNSKPNLQYTAATQLWYRCGMTISSLDELLKDQGRSFGPVYFEDFFGVIERLVQEDEEVFIKQQLSNSLEAGDFVELSEGYERYGEASNGPLQPGDRGLIVEVKERDNGDRRFVRVLHSGRRWWYEPQAVKSERSGLIDSPAVWFFRKLLRAHGIDENSLQDIGGKPVRPSSWRIGDFVVPRKPITETDETSTTSGCGRIVSDTAQSTSLLAQKPDSGFVTVEYISRPFAVAVGVLGASPTNDYSLETRRIRASKLNFADHRIIHETNSLSLASETETSAVSKKTMEIVERIKQLDLTAIESAAKECSKTEVAMSSMFSAGLGAAVHEAIGRVECDLQRSNPREDGPELIASLGRLFSVVARQLYDKSTEIGLYSEQRDMECGENIVSDTDPSRSAHMDFNSGRDERRDQERLAMASLQRRNLILSLVSRSGRRGNLHYLEDMLQRDSDIFARALPLGHVPGAFGGVRSRSLWLGPPTDQTTSRWADPQRYSIGDRSGLSSSGSDSEEQVENALEGKINSSFLNIVVRGRHLRPSHSRSATVNSEAVKSAFVRHLIEGGILLNSEDWVRAILQAQDQKIRSPGSQASGSNILKGISDDEGHSILYLALTLGCTTKVLSQLIAFGAHVGVEEVRQAANTFQPQSLSFLLEHSTFDLSLVGNLECNPVISEVLARAKTRIEAITARMQEEARGFVARGLEQFLRLSLRARRMGNSYGRSCACAVSEVLTGNVLLHALHKAQKAREELIPCMQPLESERADAGAGTSDLDADSVLTNRGILHLIPHGLIEEGVREGLIHSCTILLLIEDYLYSREMDDAATGLRLLSFFLVSFPLVFETGEIERFGFSELLSFHDAMASSRVADILSQRLKDSLTVSQGSNSSNDAAPRQQTECMSGVVLCPEHHVAALHITRHSSFRCDLCGAGVDRGRPMHGCRKCDWDACEECTDKAESGIVKFNAVKEFVAECDKLLSSAGVTENQRVRDHELLKELRGMDTTELLKSISIRILQHDVEALEKLSELLKDDGCVSAHQFLSVVLPALHGVLVRDTVRGDALVSRVGRKKARMTSDLGEVVPGKNVSFKMYLARMLVSEIDSNQCTSDETETASTESAVADSGRRDASPSVRPPELVRRLHQILSLYEGVSVNGRVERSATSESGGNMHSVNDPLELHLFPAVHSACRECEYTPIDLYCEPLVQISEIRLQILRSMQIGESSYLSFCQQLANDHAIVIERPASACHKKFRLCQVESFDALSGAHTIRYASRGSSLDGRMYDLSVDSLAAFNSLKFEGEKKKVILGLRDYYILQRFPCGKIPSPQSSPEASRTLHGLHAKSKLVGARVECKLPTDDGWTACTIIDYACETRGRHSCESKWYQVVTDEGIIFSDVQESSIKSLDVRESAVLDASNRITEATLSFPLLLARRRLDPERNDLNRENASGVCLRRSWSALSLVENMKPIDLKIPALPKYNASICACEIDGTAIELDVDPLSVEAPPCIYVTLRLNEEESGFELNGSEDVTLVSVLAGMGHNTLMPANLWFSLDVRFNSRNKMGISQNRHVEQSDVVHCVSNETVLASRRWDRPSRIRKFSARSLSDDDDGSGDLCEGLDQICIQCMEVISVVAELVVAESSRNCSNQEICLFENVQLSSKLLDSLDDPISSAGCALPDWCIRAPTYAPRVFSFESRKLLLERVAFGVSRGILKQQEAKINVSRLKQRMASLRARAVELVGEAFSGGAQDPTALQLQADELYGMEEALAARVRAAYRSARWQEHALQVVKAAVRRCYLIDDASALMEKYAVDPTVNRRRLEVRFDGESGFDAASGDEAGVTRGFYADVAEALLSCDHVAGVLCSSGCFTGSAVASLVSEPIKAELVVTESMKLPLWIPDVDSSGLTVIPTPRADSGSGLGVYPRPLPSYHPQRNEIVARFRMIGRLFASALRDGFMFPLPLSTAFLKLILSGETILSRNPLTSFDLPRPGFLGGEVFAAEEYICRALDNLDCCDPPLSRSELDRRYIELARDKNFARKAFGREYDCSFEDFFQDRTFVDPLDPTQGEDAVPLCPQGHKLPVTIYNIREWVALAKNFILHDGVVPQALAFRQGVEDFFTADYLRLFTAAELQRDVCGHGDSVDSWDDQAIRNLLKLDGGKGAAEALVAVAAIGGEGGAALSRRFGPSSPTISFLIQALLEASPKQRRQFLSFVTSVPIVTPGLIEVVPIVSPSGQFLPMRDPGCLPRANTCARRLYLPKFDTFERFAEVLWAVVREESKFKGFYEWRG